MKKLAFIFLFFVFNSCAELQQVVNQLPQTSIGLTQNDMANGLKQALQNGIDKQVIKLTQTDGFFKNQLVKIVLPDELKKVDEGLRDIGLSKLADEGLKIMNRAAEDAVKEATPIFVNAITQMTINDAKSIVLGEPNAATIYLQSSTTDALYEKFNPVIQNSFAKIGADKVWQNIISKYNTLPLVKKVNPNLTDYVTHQALNGVFKMVAIEELEIRNNINARTTDLLKKVFALQDKK